MNSLSLLPFFFTLSTRLPIPGQTKVTCITVYPAMNVLIEDLEASVRVDPTFLTSFYGSKSSLNCGGTDIQTYGNDILDVIAMPDSWCSVNGDGFGGYDRSIDYL